MSKIHQFLIKYSILLLFISVLPYRLYHLTYPLLDAHAFRQTQTATIALNFYKNGIDLLKTELDIFGVGKERYLTLEFPLYEAIVAGLYKLFFLSDSWGRIVSITAGYMGALYLYRLIILVLQRKNIAFLSAAFYLSAPLNMFFQRAFLIEPLVISFLLAGLFYACKWMVTHKITSYILALVFLILGFIQKAIYGPFWLLPLLLFFPVKNCKKKISSYVMLALLVIIPLVSSFLWQQHVNAVNSESNHDYFSSMNENHITWNIGTIQDRITWSLWQSRIIQVLNGILLKMGLIIFLIGVIITWRDGARLFWYGWLLSQIIYFVTFFRIQSHDYYQMTMIPVAAYFMAQGLMKIANYIMGWLLLIKSWKERIVPIRSLLIVIFFTFFIYKSWVNVQPFFLIDMTWYHNLVALGNILPKQSYGILVTAGYDWNSVYTYYPGRKMITTSVENLTEKYLTELHSQGYSFLILKDYQDYSDYLKAVNTHNSLTFITNYTKVLTVGGFQIYLLN